ncbi:BlaI/MecI/CopY family transcriptional regulator [Lachnospiraceae bacterium ZAX-1]
MNISLTSNELEIMELMWEKDRPLSRAEIIKFSPNSSWKASSIHILLNKLLEKGAIEVHGFVKTGKNYGRTYSPLIAQEAYITAQFRQNPYYAKPSATTAVFSALLQNDGIDDSVIEELEQMLNDRKQRGGKK